MSKTVKLTLAALGFTLASLQAQEPPMPEPGPAPEPPENFHRNLFEPELIMGNQAELKLTDDQSQAIKGILSAVRGEQVGLEWDLNQAMSALGKALASEQVDENAALALLDRVLDLERSVKRNNLKMSIQLKNKLTPEQQQILIRRRDHRAMFRQPGQPMPPQGRPGPEGDSPRRRMERPGGPEGEPGRPPMERPGGREGERGRPPMERPGGPDGEAPPPPPPGE